MLGAPATFEAELATAEGLTRAEKLEKDLDLVQAFYTRRGHLEADLSRLQTSLGAGGRLWICYPKAKGLGTDLNRDVVRQTVSRAGLQTVALVAIDEVWSALRCKPAR